MSKDNTGNYNTGYYNTGNYNTGYYNTGNRNAGNYNTGNYNTGDCNTDTSTVRLFNKDSGWAFLGTKHRKFRHIITKYQKPLSEWISECDMSQEEKDKYPTYKTTGVYLKVNKDRCNTINISEEDREFLLNVPNFDAKIFKECTGIDIDNEQIKIVIDGKVAWISKDSAMALKASLCC